MWCFAVVGVAYCQAAGWGSQVEEVDDFNETMWQGDLLVPLLVLPGEHELPEMCGPVLSLLCLPKPSSKLFSDRINPDLFLLKDQLLRCGAACKKCFAKGTHLGILISDYTFLKALVEGFCVCFTMFSGEQQI